MKKGTVKRFILLSVAAGCLLILILAMFGGLKQRDEPDRDPDPPDRGEAGSLTISKPSSEGPGWRFSADRAITADFEAMTFIKPVIVYSMESTSERLGPRNIHAAAEMGESDGADSPIITMHGNVIIEISRSTIDGDPVESGLLRSDEMTWDRSKLEGSAPGAIEIDFTEPDQRFALTGVDLRADLRLGNIWIERDVVIRIFGMAGLLHSDPAEDEEIETVITCDGPFMAEETTGKALFEKNVTVTHGDQSLRADELTVWRGTNEEGGTDVGEWRAIGNVRLVAPSAVVRGKEIARSVDGTMRLSGNSNGSVQLEGLEIEAPTIIMNLQQGLILAPDKGRLVMAPQEEDGQPIVAVWGGNMEFDQENGRAYFTKEVHVTGQDLNIRGDALTLWVDPETNEPLRMLAEGNVVMVMPTGTARGDSVLMNMKDQTLELRGRPEASLDMDETRIKGREITADLENEKINVRGTGSLTVASEDEEKQPISASWRGGMIFDKNTGKAEINRNARVVTDDSEVECDELDLWLTEDGGEVDRILARGNVKLNTPEGDGEASRVTYHMAKRHMDMEGGEEYATFEHAGNIITAKNITMDGETGSLTSSEPGTLRQAAAKGEAGAGAFQRAEISWNRSMSFDTNAGRGRFIGDVKMTDAERVLHGDTIDLKLTEDEAKDMESITALGNVRLDWDGSRGYGETFFWIAESGDGYLNGRPNEPARVAFEQGWFIGDQILFRDNFKEVTVKGSRPARAGISGG